MSCGDAALRVHHGLPATDNFHDHGPMAGRHGQPSGKDGSGEKVSDLGPGPSLRRPPVGFCVGLFGQRVDRYAPKDLDLRRRTWLSMVLSIPSRKR